MPLIQGPGGRLIGRGTWHTEEDEALKAAVKIHGTKSWAVVSTRVPGRTGKQCRERWTSKLDPSVRQEPWSKQEDAKLISSQAKYGGRWSKIARSLPGRSEAAAKQRFAILSQTKLPNAELPLEAYAGKGKRERSPAISPPPPAPRPPTFYQELASPAIRGESHGGTTPSVVDVLASPSKRRKNLVLRAGADGLLLPDDATSATQHEQEGGAAPQPDPSGAATQPGEKGKAVVQPYTGADADAYDLIPTVPSWKAPDTPLQINVGGPEASSDGEDAQAHWQRSTAEDMRSPLGDGDGMFSNNDEGRKAVADVAKTSADEDADEVQLRRTAGFGSSAVAAVPTDLFLSLHRETEAAAAAAAAGGVIDDGVSVALARSCQNTTFCPQDEEFLYRRRRSVALKPVPKTLLQGKDTMDFHAELHVPTDGSELQKSLTSSVLQDWATNTNANDCKTAVGKTGGAGATSTRDCGEQVGALLSKELKKRQSDGQTQTSSSGTGTAVRLHESQKAALHRDLLWRLFWSSNKGSDQNGGTKARETARSKSTAKQVPGSKGASINMLR